MMFDLGKGVKRIYLYLIHFIGFLVGIKHFTLGFFLWLSKWLFFLITLQY